MEKNKKKTVRRIVFAAVVLALAGGLAALPFMLEARQKENAKASVLSAELTRGTISKTLSGTGTITEQDAEAVSVPAGVKVTEYLVSNGQFVSEGEAVATVDKVSVMETISSLREEMTALSKKIESARSSGGSVTISAPASAKVKAIYAAAGDSVSEVMLEHGALAVLSLDGLMTVSFPEQGALSIGDAVSVTLSDGKTVAGRVESVRDGTAVVTISDSYGSIGEEVRILSTDGTLLGSGALAVHSAWKAVGTGGTVQRVSVAEGRNVYQGTVVITLSSSGSESYADLLGEYRQDEETMAELFSMYVDGVLKAPCDGIVSGVDSSILEKLSSGDGAALMFLANAPGDDPDRVYENCIGMVTAVNEDGTITALMQSWNTEIEDYADMGFLVTASDSMTKEATFPRPTAIVWNSDEGQWAVGGNCEPGDVFVFVYGESVVWMIKVGHGELPEPEPKPQPDPQPTTTPDGSGSNTGTPDMSGIQIPSGVGGTGTANAAAPAAAEESASEKRTTILSVTPQEYVTIPITVDELDILSVHTGQEVLLTLDALPGQAFSGVIEEINTTASNDGGNSKYSAVVRLDRTGMMLGGMNACATITVETLEDVLLLPAAALTEQNGQSMVYTGYDSREETLTGLVPVELGLSDGEHVQILSGLSEGDTVWYRYYDTLEIQGLS